MAIIKGGIVDRFQKSSYLSGGKNFFYYAPMSFAYLLLKERVKDFFTTVQFLKSSHRGHCEPRRAFRQVGRGEAILKKDYFVASAPRNDIQKAAFFEIIVTYCRTMTFVSVFISSLFTLSLVFAAQPMAAQVTPTEKTVNPTPLQQASDKQADIAQNNPAPQFSGEIFGVQVPLQNNYFINGVLSVFGNKWGPQPQTEEELKKVVWDQLLMSFEAFRRGLVVNQEEINEEVNKIIAAEKVDFDWKKDRAAYEKWVKNKTNESVEIFEGQLKHLIQIQKLRQQVMDSVEPAVSEEEAYQEFTNENNNLSVELVQFDAKKDADIFYNKARGNAKFWEEEKVKRPKDFKRPGAVSLEFLIDMWGFPKDACYKMLKMNAGQLYPADTIYKGYAVFKILSKGLADKSRYAKWKTGYYDQIKNRKKLEALGKWFEDLKKQANLKIYETPKEG